MSIQKWMKYEFGHIWFGLKTNGEKNHKIITGYSFQKTKMITKCPTKSFALENEFWNNREHQKKTCGRIKIHATH